MPLKQHSIAERLYLAWLLKSVVVYESLFWNAPFLTDQSVLD